MKLNEIQSNINKTMTKICRWACTGGETVLCQSEEEDPWDGRDQTIMFQLAVSFKHVQKGFAGFS